jgi:hypothetical protein
MPAPENINNGIKLINAPFFRRKSETFCVTPEGLANKTGRPEETHGKVKLSLCLSN